MKSLRIISLILVVLAVGGLLARYGRSLRLSPFSTGPAGDMGDVGPVVRFEPFLVSEGDGQHYSTVTFEVEVSDNDGRDAIKLRTSAMRSAILTVLADTKLSDVGVPEDFETLKKKVQDRVQSVLPDYPVRRVLITQFLSL